MWSSQSASYPLYQNTYLIYWNFVLNLCSQFSTWNPLLYFQDCKLLKVQSVDKIEECIYKFNYSQHFMKNKADFISNGDNSLLYCLWFFSFIITHIWLLLCASFDHPCVFSHSSWFCLYSWNSTYEPLGAPPNCHTFLTILSILDLHNCTLCFSWHFFTLQFMIVIHLWHAPVKL